MRAIAIDSNKLEIYEFNVEGRAEIRGVLGETEESAHSFKNGDTLMIGCGDRGWYEALPSFSFGSERYDFKYFKGNAVVIGGTVWKIADAKSDLELIRRLVRFGDPARFQKER